jgi:hypothetical protein
VTAGPTGAPSAWSWQTNQSGLCLRDCPVFLFSEDKEKMMRDTEAILESVIWLIDQCDDHSLKEVQHLPFLEIAKWFTRTRCIPSLHPLRKEVKERRLIPALLTAVARQGNGSWSVKLEWLGTIV